MNPKLLARLKAQQMLMLATKFNYPDEIRIWTQELNKLDNKEL